MGLRDEASRVSVDLTVTPLRTREPDEPSSAGKVDPRERTERALIEAREQEVELGSRIQQGLLLGEPPTDLPGVRVGTLRVPSRKVDGDFFDFFQFGDRSFDFFLGDVMGKGVSAALVGAAAKSHLLRSAGGLLSEPGDKGLPPPERIIGMTHAKMTPKLIEIGSFVTMCYARFDLDARRIVYVDCGHTKPIHLRRSEGTCESLEGDNTPLGTTESETYGERSTAFEPEDIFLFYSDGLTDLLSPDGEAFGEARVRDLLMSHADLDPMDLVEKIRRAAIDFARTPAFGDDLSCVVIKVEEAGEELRAQTESIRFSSDLDELARMRDLVRRFCRETLSPPLGEEATFQVLLAAHEASTNIIRHGGGKGGGESIDLRIEATPERVMLRFLHRGPAWMPTGGGPDLSGSSEGGFGLYIIDQCVDHAEYGRLEDGRNLIRLVKNR